MRRLVGAFVPHGNARREPLTNKFTEAVTKIEIRTAERRKMSLQSQLVGTWKLISAEDKDSKTGQWVPYTFGNPPSGYFIYDDTGHASIQIMTTPPQQIAKPDSPTPNEALAIFNAYIAYYGTYTVDSANITVKVEGAWDPSQVGTDQVRPYELSGDTLIIGDQETYKRTLQRMK
jgi:hypothetical protein